MKTPLTLTGILAAAVLATGIWAWTPDRSRGELARKYDDEATHYLEVAGTTLRVRDTGSKLAPAILLLHGFGSSLETWEPWSQSLSASYRVVRFDLPGSGLSIADRTGRFTDPRTLEIINSLMSELQIERAVIVGNSVGGRIAWQFAAAFPARVSKLVLISPDGFASPGFEYGRSPKVPTALKLMKYFLPKVLLRQNLNAAYADPSRLTQATLDRYYDLLLAPGNRQAMIARMQQTVLENPVPLLRRIETPTLLLWGQRDRMIPYANAADYMRNLPNATLVSLPTLGHVPHEELPDESIKPLLQFMTQ